MNGYTRSQGNDARRWFIKLRIRLNATAFWGYSVCMVAFPKLAVGPLPYGIPEISVPAEVIGGTAGAALGSTFPPSDGITGRIRGGLEGLGAGAGAVAGAHYLSPEELSLKSLLGAAGGGVAGYAAAAALARLLGLGKRKEVPTADEEREKQAWLSVPGRLRETVGRAVMAAKEAEADGGKPVTLWLDIETGAVVPETCDVAGKFASLRVETGDPTRHYALIKSAGEGTGVAPFDSIAKGLNFAPTSWNEPLGGPSPLLAALTGGAATAGLGYLGGAAIERLAPPGVFQKGRLRRTMAILGGGVGALPGLYAGHVAGRLDPESPWYRPWLDPNPFMGGSSEDMTDPTPEVKQAAGEAGALFLPSIPVDAFNRAVIDDPFLTPQMQAATTGIVTAADLGAGGPGLISVGDIARLGIRMGAGAFSAYSVGRVLGALAGLGPGPRRQLQNAGMFAGALEAVVPRMYGR